MRIQDKRTISIKNPCTEKFNNFSKTNEGGFCNSCNKEVIDFRKMTHQEIIVFFEKSNENICGYFNKTQLKTENSIETNQNKIFLTFIRSRILSFSLVSFLATYQGFSQQIPKEKTIKVLGEHKKEKSVTALNSEYYKGLVTDEDGEPLLGVNINIKGTNIMTITDFDGFYSLPKNKINTNTILMASSLGFETTQIRLSDGIGKMKATKMEMMSCILGEVATEQVYQSKLSLGQRIKSFFKHD